MILYILDKLKDKNKIRQFCRFILVGGIATILHYTIFVGLNKLGIQLNIAYTLGYALSFIFNYVASNYFTFNVTPNAKSGIKFMGAHVTNYVLQMILLNLYLNLGVADFIAPIGVFIITIPVNFILVRIALKK